MTDTNHKTVRDIVHEQHTKPTRWDADTNHTDSVDAKMSIEEMVEKLAACRYTGNPKTYPSEENYKANLTIVLARCLQSHTSQQVEELKTEITDLKATCFTLDDVHQQVEEARDQEAKLWFETWYSHYIAPKQPLPGEFGKFATERIQMTGYQRDHALTPNHQD